MRSRRCPPLRRIGYGPERNAGGGGAVPGAGAQGEALRDMIQKANMAGEIWLPHIDENGRSTIKAAVTLGNALSVWHSRALGPEGRLVKHTGDGDCRVVVPRPLRHRPLRLAHDEAGHFGIDKTLANLRLFTGESFTKDVGEYMAARDCRLQKHACHKLPGPLHPLAPSSRPWESISMDFKEMPPSHTGCDQLLVVVEGFSKSIVLVPSRRTIPSSDLARLLVRHVFRDHGIPESVVSDQGTQFTSRFVTDLARALGTRQRLSAAYHPQTDAPTEVANRPIGVALRALTAKQATLD